MLGSAGKFLTVSLKAHFSSITETGGGTSGGMICDPSEPDSLIYNFTARRKNCYDQEWCNCWPYGEDVLAEIMGETWSRSGSCAVSRVQHTEPRLWEGKRKDDERGNPEAGAGAWVRGGGGGSRTGGQARFNNCLQQ